MPSDTERIDWDNGFWAGQASRDTEVAELRAQLAERDADLVRLRSLINTPLVDSFLEAVQLEAAHQVERWGAEHDAGKEPSDWLWLLGYLGGKALRAAIDGNVEKAKHHTISRERPMPSEAELRALIAKWRKESESAPGFQTSYERGYNSALKSAVSELESLLASQGPEHPHIGSRIDVEHMAEAGHLRNADGSCDQCEPEQAARESGESPEYDRGWLDALEYVCGAADIASRARAELARIKDAAERSGS